MRAGDRNWSGRVGTPKLQSWGCSCWRPKGQKRALIPDSSSKGCVTTWLKLRETPGHLAGPAELTSPLHPRPHPCFCHSPVKSPRLVTRWHPTSWYPSLFSVSPSLSHLWIYNKQLSKTHPWLILLFEFMKQVLKGPWLRMTLMIVEYSRTLASQVEVDSVILKVTPKFPYQF